MISSSKPQIERGLDTMVLVYSVLHGHPPSSYPRVCSRKGAKSPLAMLDHADSDMSDYARGTGGIARRLSGKLSKPVFGENAGRGGRAWSTEARHQGRGSEEDVLSRQGKGRMLTDRCATIRVRSLDHDAYRYRYHYAYFHAENRPSQIFATMREEAEERYLRRAQECIRTFFRGA